MKLKYLMPLLFLAFSFASCRVQFLSISPKRSAERIVMVDDLDQKTSDIYLRMTTGGVRTYSLYEGEYVAIERGIDSLKNIYTRLDKGKKLLQMVTTIKEKFAAAKAYHIYRNILTTGEASSYQNSFKGLWKPVRVSEQGLK